MFHLKKHCLLFCRLGFLFIILTLSANSNAQQKARVTGQILDEVTRNPVPSVNIFFEKTRNGTISDKKGHYTIENVNPGSKMLVIQHIAYANRKISLKLTAQQIKRLDILLTPNVLPLDEIVFTAGRHAETLFQSHQNITMATEEEISQRTSSNTADAVREMPGVLVQKTTAGHGSPVVRGMIGKDVLLLYNGIRLNKPTFRFGANQYMNTIDAESLERIEVIKGPGSVMYGSDAIGGVVNMISESPLAFEQIKGLRTTISTRYGSADLSRIFHSKIINSFGRVVLSSGITLKKIGNLRAGSDIGSQSPTGYDEWNGNLKIGVRLSQQTSLDFDFLYVSQKEVPRYDKYVNGSYQTYLYDPQNRLLSSVTLISRPEKINWISSMQWNFSYQVENEGTIERKTGSELITKNRNDLTTFGSFLQINSVLPGNHVLTYGYDIYRDRVESRRTREQNGSVGSRPRGNFPDGSTYRSLGSFINDNIIFSSKFDLTFGFRWSQMVIYAPLDEQFGNFTDTYDDLTGTAGFSFKPVSWLNIIGTYAKGFRAPNFNDAVVLKVSNSGVDAPSRGLSPEKSHNFELGVKLDREKTNGSFFVFYNRLNDLIDRYLGTYNGLSFFDENENGIREPDEADIYQKRNVARAYIGGWELAGNYRFSSEWSFRGSTFWTYGKNVTVNEPMSRIPPLMVLVAIRYSPSSKYSIETFVRAAGDQNRLSSRDKDDSRIDPGGTPGWWTLNIRCGYQIIKGLKLNVTIENILDETYKEHGSGVYSPGRNFVVGLRYGGG